MTVRSTFQNFKDQDAQRADLPGEHLGVLAVGVLLLIVAGRGRSVLVRTVVGAAATALIGRAASGTGGVAKLAAFLSGRRARR